MTFDRRSANQSFISKKLQATLEGMEAELLKKLEKYADGEHSQVKIEPAGPGMVRVRMWIHLEEEGWSYKPGDFREVAEILLGDDVSYAVHRMNPHIMIATKEYQF